MSVIVRDEEGKLLLLSKGADRFANLFITYRCIVHDYHFESGLDV